MVKAKFSHQENAVDLFLQQPADSIRAKKSTKPHPSSLQEFDLSSHAFILASVLVEKSLTVPETNTLFVGCLKHLREYTVHDGLNLIQNGYHKRFLENRLTKSLFEHRLKLITFISQKQTIKLSAVLFWVMKGRL